jgi:hypothetical protein
MIMRFVLNIILVVLFLALPVAVHGTSDVSIHSDAGMEQSADKAMIFEPDHEDPCASLGPGCQSEISACMMDCCLMVALSPATIPMDQNCSVGSNRAKG